MNKPYIDENEQAFRYLFSLQESGITNMFGAVPYLQRNQNPISKQDAQALLMYWMKNYQEIADYLHINQ